MARGTVLGSRPRVGVVVGAEAELSSRGEPRTTTGGLLASWEAKVAVSSVALASVLLAGGAAPSSTKGVREGRGVQPRLRKTVRRHRYDQGGQSLQAMGVAIRNIQFAPRLTPFLPDRAVDRQGVRRGSQALELRANQYPIPKLRNANLRGARMMKLLPRG